MKKALQGLTATLSTFCLLAAAPRAGAGAGPDSKQKCAAAYEKTQISREQGKLVDARKQALACSASTCSAYVTRDCIVWLAEIEAMLPTVILAAVDPTGAATRAVRVTVDGEVLAEQLDGKAVPVDPGDHVVQFEMESVVIEQKVSIRQGEKNRLLTASFKREPPVAPASAPLPPTAPASPPLVPPKPTAQPGGDAPAWAWLSGAGGVVLLGVGAAFGVSALEAHRSLIEKCAVAGGNLARCPESTSAETVPLTERRELHRSLSLGLGAAGVVAIGAAVLGIVLVPSKTPASRASLVLAPMASPSGGGAQCSGRF